MMKLPDRTITNLNDEITVSGVTTISGWQATPDGSYLSLTITNNYDGGVVDAGILLTPEQVLELISDLGARYMLHDKGTRCGHDKFGKFGHCSDIACGNYVNKCPQHGLSENTTDCTNGALTNDNK